LRVMAWWQCARIGVFFFQAEDGIRDWSVTGVQTCALPILQGDVGGDALQRDSVQWNETGHFAADLPNGTYQVSLVLGDRYYGKRSEERRVGKECGTRGAPRQ